MADYSIEAYNAEMSAIQDKEARALAGALEIYATATRTITEQAAQERMEAGVKLAASMSQRDHEYHNGRPAPKEEPDKKVLTWVEPKPPYDREKKPELEIASGLSLVPSSGRREA